MKQETVIKVLIAALGLTGGFGLSQLTVAGEVSKHAVEIINIRKELADERVRTDERIRNVANLMAEMVRQNNEFINLLRVQNEILNRRQP